MRLLGTLGLLALMLVTASNAVAQVVGGQPHNTQQIDQFSQIALGNQPGLLGGVNRDQIFGWSAIGGAVPSSFDWSTYNLTAALAYRSKSKSSEANEAGNQQMLAWPLHDTSWHQMVFPLDGTSVFNAGSSPFASLSIRADDNANAFRETMVSSGDKSTEQFNPPSPPSNIHAVTVPEPGALGLTALALAWAIGSFRKARKPRAE